MKVQIFIPCFIDQLYPSVGFNMVKVLEKAGCEILYNPNQTCCGQPAFNAGFWNDAKSVCKKFISDFEKDIPVVIPSASCTGFIRNNYAQLFKGSESLSKIVALQERTFEFSEFLLNYLKKDDFGACLEGIATYHDSCAALRECHIKNGPRQLLKNVKGLQLVEMEDVETCCGFGGSFAVKYEAISNAMGEQKVNHALDTKAEILISTDMSCLMHLDGYIQKNKRSLKVMHLADVLASGW
ncbi:MAG: (Fe-S)-binding protein [Bacteroidetes bacterium]|nr:(Fe-S)-binding protein [Bacteroidota bacterium]